TPTKTKTPTPTPYSFYDDFSNNNSGWAIVNNPGWYLAGYTGNDYEIDVFSGDSRVWVVNPTIGNMDYTVEADIRLYNGSEIMRYGLVFDMVNAGQFYVFSVIPSVQGYSSEKADNGNWTGLADGSNISTINGGYATNHLRVEKNGSQITISVNGYYLDTFYGGDFSSNNYWLGLYAKSGSNVPIIIRYDNFSVQEQ
ncbi:MAG: hypothetical protein B6242_10795, partial [Anaerolineaceae bacterium 4572_78]